MDIEKIENSFKETKDKKCAISKKGMVSSGFPNATHAGVEVLKKGGNAIDAACATALALGVCEPQASGIGGQSMAILYVNKKSIAIDGSSRSPSLAHSSIYQKKRNRDLGYKSSTVPSTLAVLGHLHERYGRLEWPKIVRPLGFDAGIRTLERTIQGLVRKVAKMTVEGKGKEFYITQDNLKQFVPTY